MNSPPTARFHCSPISSNEACQILGSLKNSAPGFDNVNAELLQVISNVIAEPLTHIFNLSFSNGIVPQELKTAKIIPIYKGENPTIFTNYRPIYLLPTISKILEKLSYNRLLRYLDENDILFQHQYGFRESRSTYMAITHVTNEYWRRFRGGRMGLVPCNILRWQNCPPQYSRSFLRSDGQRGSTRHTWFDWLKSQHAARYTHGTWESRSR